MVEWIDRRKYAVTRSSSRWGDPALGPLARRPSPFGAIAVLVKSKGLGVRTCGVKEWGGKPGSCSPCDTQQKCLETRRWVSSSPIQCDRLCATTRALESACRCAVCSPAACAASLWQQFTSSMFPHAMSEYEIRINHTATRFIYYPSP